jgi:cyclic pyranopterin monophosphate synthase
MQEKDFTHLDEKTGNPKMVDVGHKASSKRVATASCEVVLGEEIMAKLLDDKEVLTKKGPVFQTAIIAGTMGVKKTSELIPLCHPLIVEKIDIKVEPSAKDRVTITCTVGLSGKTGVEMEALTGATITALTIYDMCKGFSHDITIKETKLIKKTGGKSDFQR